VEIVADVVEDFREMRGGLSFGEAESEFLSTGILSRRVPTLRDSTRDKQSPQMKNLSALCEYGL